MPVFLLDDSDRRFPPPELADESGLLAVGGDLQPERLIAAYASGIFPWYQEGDPILWHAPDPRFVLEPSKLHVPRSLRRTMARGTFEVRFDTAFADVIAACAGTGRPGQAGTWITPEMQSAYERLHHLGLAHSVESWADGQLAGGLYGVALGGTFFGESMFARVSDASKVAFVALVERLRGWGFPLVDCQQETEHLERFGAESWPRPRFQEALRASLLLPTRRGPWW